MYAPIRTCCALFIIGAIALTASAQVVNVPDFYVWSRQPCGIPAPSASAEAPQLWNMVRVDLHDAGRHARSTGDDQRKAGGFLASWETCGILEVCGG